MKKALIIEDTEDNWILISALLEQGGYTTQIAITGEAGYDLAIREEFDLIILDVQLPGMNGDAVIKKIRNNASIKQVPVIAMTSYAMSGDREKLLGAGCTGYIEKPIDPLCVLEQIERMIKGA